MKKFIPAISIIIPMYNAEKYVGECLDSILVQTFTDYEVIVVDDCSTDQSYKIVESFIPKFNRGGVDKLQLIHAEKNSGGAGTPRNTALRLSRGEYVFIMDSDDAITETALEELYTSAKKFDADIVHCEKWYIAPGESVTTDKRFLRLSSVKDVNPNYKSIFVDTPTLITDNPAEKVSNFCEGKFWWAPWSHLIKRKLLVENNIEFSTLSVAEDLVFSFFVMFTAKKIVYVPNVIYIWRILMNSNSRAQFLPDKTIHKRAGALFKGIPLLENFTNKYEFFKEYPEYRYAIFSFFTDNQVGNYVHLYMKIPAYALDEFVRKELDAIGNNTALTSLLFGQMSVLHANLIQLKNLLAQKAEQEKRRQMGTDRFFNYR